jgi:hypothetical protein
MTSSAASSADVVAGMALEQRGALLQWENILRKAHGTSGSGNAEHSQQHGQGGGGES